jgi:FkbM family methyltransferase
LKNTICSIAVKTNFRTLIAKRLDKYIIRRLERKSLKLNRERRTRIAIFANEHIGFHINQYGYYDRFNLELLFAFLKPLEENFKGSLALDIGANIGNHSILFSNYFDAVYAFEPNQRTFDLLQLNSKTFDNVFPFNFGFGDEVGCFTLNENPNNMGASSIKYSDFSDAQQVEIALKKLDDIDLSSANISFVKIDVEGFESNVIRGGLNVLEASQPLVVFEQHESEFKNGSTDAIELLKSIGYRFCWQTAESRQKGWLSRKISAIRNLFFETPVNYIFVTDDAVPCKKHGMLIAVPARFQSILGFDATSTRYI